MKRALVSMDAAVPFSVPSPLRQLAAPGFPLQPGLDGEVGAAI